MMLHDRMRASTPLPVLIARSPAALLGLALIAGCGADPARGHVATAAATAPAAGDARSATAPATAAPTDAEVLALLRGAVADDGRADRRDDHLNAHVQLLATRLVHAMHPDTYARQRLVSRGRAIVEPCLRVAADPRQDKRVARMAWEVLASFDDRRVYSGLADAAGDARWDFVAYGVMVSHCLAISDVIIDTTAAKDRAEMARLLKRLAEERDYRGMVLPLLDAAAKDDRGFGLPYGGQDAIRWLNRLGDEDLDAWLAARTPEGKAWRDTQLAKGYDPLIALDFGAAYLELDLAKEATKAFADPADGRGCAALFRAFYDATLADGAREPEGYRERVRAWYRANRDKLVYDPAKMRFVVPVEGRGPHHGGGVP